MMLKTKIQNKTGLQTKMNLLPLTARRHSFKSNKQMPSYSFYMNTILNPSHMNTKKNINPWACLSLGLLLVGCSQPFEVTSKMDTTNSETTNFTIHIEQSSFVGTNDPSKK